MMQRTRRPLSSLIAALMLAGTSLPGLAQSPTPFFTLPQPSGTDPSQLAGDYVQLQDQLRAVNQLLLTAKVAHRDAPLGEATTNLILAGMALNTAGMQLDQGNVKTAARDLRLAHERLRIAQLQMMPSRVSEARGIYLDGGSIPKTKAGIVALLDQLAAAKFNMITPEVFRRGYSLWPSNLTDADPEFAACDFDVLGFLITEAHQRNMEVHPWFWVFRVRSPGFGNPVLTKLPGIEASKAGFVEPRFISPASPEGRAFAVAIINDLKNRYPVDGITLDYVRYDETLGDDDISVTKFKMQYYQKHGHYPADLSHGSPIYAEWQLWREAQVNQVVATIAKEVKVPIGASVFRGFNSTRLAKMQDWHHWVDNRWIQYVSHMLYTADVKDLDTWLDWETDHGKRLDLLYPILGPLRFKRHDDLYPQLDLLRQRLIPGSTLFALAHFDRATLPELTEGPYRLPAYLPHRSLSQAARREIDGAADWLDRIQGEPTADPAVGRWARRLHALWTAMPADERNFRPQNAQMTLRELDRDVESAQQSGTIDAPFGDEIRLRLRYPQQLLELQRLSLRDAKYVPPTSPMLGVLAEAKTLPDVVIPRLRVRPVFDAKADPAWSEAITFSDFYWANGMARAEANTVVRVGFDPSTLFVRVEAEEFAMAAIKAGERQRDNRSRFADDDRFDLLLQAPGGAEYTFSVNLNNQQFDAKGRDANWSASWTSNVTKQNTGWTLEMAVPFAAMGVMPERGAWKANLCRYRKQEQRPLACWAAPLGESPVPARFGTWQFAPMPAAR
ncbi:MAG: family 10 glycosylhydrolase [Candidatus Sericytochromatia bacterium]|nr:family 10 glycosylhydrolase [Candidatus Sericytochromatia bacterium]